MVPVSHCPHRCRLALARAAGPVVLDLETTGLRRHDRIVSAGLLVDGVAHVLFVRAAHVSIRNLAVEEFREALRPLERPDLVVVGHNLRFDLGFLLRDGIAVRGEPRDTLKLLRLLDQDRGGDGSVTGRREPRKDLRSPDGAPARLDYKLKHVAGQLLGLRMPHFPGAIALAPYRTHATYLACDLVGTQALYDFLWPQLPDALRRYYRELVAPLLPVQLAMTEQGTAADPDFIEDECRKLADLLARLSAEHRERHGVMLGMNERDMCAWLFRRLRLPVLRRKRLGRRWLPSLDKEAIRRLRRYTENPAADDSLRRIQEYRKAAGLLQRLRSLARYIDARSGRIHSTFDDKQASGRISSSYPNLQQLAKKQTFGSVEIKYRNALRASEDCELIAFDIAQADIRVLAAAVENFSHTSDEHLAALHRERWTLLGPHLAAYRDTLQQCRNLVFVGTAHPPPVFNPGDACRLAQASARRGISTATPWRA
jgi:DNA polymerase I-like protein with 3'-5' exonuclease and polymerase domains